MLQPQRRLSAELLSQPEQNGYTPQTIPIVQGIAVCQKYAAMICATSYRVFCRLSAQLRKPVYVLVALLFCLLMAGMGAVSFTLSSATMRQAQAPHLAVSTTLLDLSPVKDVRFSTPNFQHVNEQVIFASNVLTLHNTGARTLYWRLDTVRSIVLYLPSEVRLWTIPSHGVLDSNEHSQIQVVASGIVRTNPAFRQNIELGSIVFASNGGDASIRTILKSTTAPEHHLAPQSGLLKTALPYSAALPAYVLRRQNL